jgi:hypothetical protein
MGRHGTNGINENGEMFIDFVLVKDLLLEGLCLNIKKYIKIFEFLRPQNGKSNRPYCNKSVF